MRSSGNRGISRWSPSCRAASLPAVTTQRSDERAGDGAHAPDDEHGEYEHRNVERVLPRVRAADHLHPQRSGEGDDGDAQRPRRPPRPEAVDADRRRGDLVLAGRNGEPPAARLTEHRHDEQRGEGSHPQPGVRLDARDAGQAARATRQLLPVLDRLVDDEQHRQRDHRCGETAGAGDGDPDGGTDGDGDDDTDHRGADGTELDVAEAERQVRQRARFRRHGDRDDRRAVRGDLGEGEVPEREDARQPDERLQSHDEDEVDQQLLHEQFAGRPAGCRVGDRSDEQHGEERAARHEAAQRRHHTRSAVCTVNRPCGRTTKSTAISTKTTASVIRSHTPSGR